MQDEIINTTDGAAAFLGYSKSHLYKLMSKKKISYSKPGGKIANFLRSDLEAYMVRNRISSEEDAEKLLVKRGRKK